MLKQWSQGLQIGLPNLMVSFSFSAWGANRNECLIWVEHQPLTRSSVKQALLVVISNCNRFA
jgi:hypothetical protein